MDSFEDVGLSAELVEALSAEGIERPTPLQKSLIPLVRKGNNALVRAGPGSGTLVGYGAGLLDRLEAGGQAPRAVVLVASAEAARSLAESLARLALTTGHVVAALGSAWALPERSDILFSTPPDLLALVRGSRIQLEGLKALVVDGAALVQRVWGLEGLETLAEFLSPDAQRVVVSLPVTAEVESFVRAHAKKAVHVPPEALSPASGGGPDRGSVQYRICREDKDVEIVRVVHALLDGGADHAMIFCRSDDRAADVGDFLTLHGFMAGAPGDPTIPVWLAVDEKAARSLLQDSPDREKVATLSVDTPADVDTLDLRHGRGGAATVLVTSRELPHLKVLAGGAGYRLLPAPAELPRKVASSLERHRSALVRLLQEEDLAGELLTLQPLFERYDPAEVAAAASHLAKHAGRPRSGVPIDADANASGAHPPSRAPAWIRLFISIGERDGIRPADLLGAVTGETGIDGAQVGKIEIRDTFSRVEIQDVVAAKVVKALNGTTMRGRSIRADYDRGSSRGQPRRQAGSGRRGGPSAS